MKYSLSDYTKKKKEIDLNNYTLYICDMDGTLYYQRQLQLLMMISLLKHLLTHPKDYWKLQAIYYFRKLRNNDSNQNAIKEESFDDSFYQIVASKLKKDKNEIKDVIFEWICQNPLSLLKKCADYQLIDMIKDWRKSSKKVVILSDYPAKEKADALELTVDGIYSATDSNIMSMKPSTKGFEMICKEYKTDTKNILVIGDRFSKDAKMAINGHIDYIILDRYKLSRRKTYHCMKQK